jgi:hypothetical protein
MAESEPKTLLTLGKKWFGVGQRYLLYTIPAWLWLLYEAEHQFDEHSALLTVISRAAYWLPASLGTVALLVAYAWRVRPPGDGRLRVGVAAFRGIGKDAVDDAAALREELRDEIRKVRDERALPFDLVMVEDEVDPCDDRPELEKRAVDVARQARCHLLVAASLRAGTDGVRVVRSAVFAANPRGSRVGLLAPNVATDEGRLMKFGELQVRHLSRLAFLLSSARAAQLGQTDDTARFAQAAEDHLPEAKAFHALALLEKGDLAGSRAKAEELRVARPGSFEAKFLTTFLDRLATGERIEAKDVVEMVLQNPGVGLPLAHLLARAFGRYSVQRMSDGISRIKEQIDKAAAGGTPAS